MEDDTQISLEINNIASGLSRWIVPFIVRGEKSKIRLGFFDLIERLNKALKNSYEI